MFITVVNTVLKPVRCVPPSASVSYTHLVSGFFGDRFFYHCGTAVHTASLISSAGWSLTVISASLTLISGVIIAVTETSASVSYTHLCDDG